MPADQPKLNIADRIYPNEGGELFFGIVSPVGTDEQRIVDEFIKQLTAREYDVVVIRLSELISWYAPEIDKTFNLGSGGEYERIRTLQSGGNTLRDALGNGILAELGCARIAQERARGEAEDWKPEPKRKAYIIRTLKHPEEAALFRTVYGHGFYLIAMHGAYDSRVANLMRLDMKEDQAQEIIQVDDKEAEDFGQNTREAFELADFFVNESDDLACQVDRFVGLLFGALYISPTKDEYGMLMAAAAAQRSIDLARQVGSAICNSQGDLIAAGCNEVHKAGGGSYWTADVPDVRDWALGEDPNDAEKGRRFVRLRESLGKAGFNIPDDAIQAAWKDSGLRDITEFGRTVHAEMDSITSCVRRGVSTEGMILFCTTFPCHNCARHIVACGITRVVYIEPYAKSEAYSLYGDSIECQAIPAPSNRKARGDKVIRFEPFVGIAPRRFSDFFSMRHMTGQRIERKTKDGKTFPQHLEDLMTPRLRLSQFSYMQREQFAIRAIQSILVRDQK